MHWSKLSLPINVVLFLNSFGKKRKGRSSYTSAHVKRPDTLCIHNTKYI